MRTGVLATVLAAVAMATGATSAEAATIDVTTTTDSAAAAGQCSLREAIAAVNTPGSLVGDCAMADDQSNTIVLGPDTYQLTIKPTGTDDQTTGDLDVTGTTPLAIQGAGMNATTISATGLGDRVLDVSLKATVTIEDLTLTGGHAPDGAAGKDGVNGDPSGGSPPTAGGNGAPGGGILNAGTLTIQDAALTDNTAGSGGRGGVGQTLEQGAGGGNGGAGGGIENTGGLTVTDATVSGNAAGDGGTGGAGGAGGSGGPGANGGCCGDGGGIANVGGTVKITGSTFAGNHAGAGGDGGGGGDGLGLNFVGGTGATAAGGSSGGAIATSGGTVTVVNSTLTGNFGGPGGNGGNGGVTNVTSSEPSGGGAGNGSAGGGLFVHGGATASLTNVTVNGNFVGAPGTPGQPGSGSTAQAGAVGNPAFGGGVYDNGAPATALTDTLLASNELGNCAGDVTDDGHNLVFGVAAGCPTTFTLGDPKLGALQNNGGPTQTEDLGAGSAAAGQGAGCAATDQRGVTRTASCDIGAYQVEAPAASTGAATAVGRSSATLHGSVTANQATASFFFQIGTVKSAGQQTAGVVPVAVTTNVTGLKPGTTYHYELVATSIDGTTAGTAETFTTEPAPPAIARLKVKRAEVSYRDSEAATTTFVIARCSKHGCRRARTFEHRDRDGANSFKLKTAGLKHGRYRLSATPIADGARGRTVSVRFEI